MSYYKYIPQEIVLVASFIGVPFQAEVFSRYTSDKHNHPAAPHKRYVVIDNLGESYDLAEVELESVYGDK